MLKLSSDIVPEVAKGQGAEVERAYLRWEKGSVIVFGHQLMLLYK